eukprot:COSAG04_NODE_729_length_10753_cov_2.112728_12_plen_968_part_00
MPVGILVRIEKKDDKIVASPHCLAPIQMVVVVRKILLKVIAFIMTPLYNVAIQYHGYCVSATIFFIQCNEIVGIMDAQLLDAALIVDSQLQQENGHGCSLVFSGKLCLPTTRLFHGAHIAALSDEETCAVGQPNSSKLSRSVEQLLRVHELVSTIRQRIDQRDAGRAEKSAIQSLQTYFVEAELQSLLDAPLSPACKSAAHRGVVKFHEALARTFKTETMERRLKSLAPLLDVLRTGGILDDKMMAGVTPNLRMRGFTHIGSVRGGTAAGQLRREKLSQLSFVCGYQPFHFEINRTSFSGIGRADAAASILRKGEAVQVLDQVDGRWHDATIVSAAVPNCIAEPCEHCGQAHDGTFGTGRFCSQQCKGRHGRRCQLEQGTRIRLRKTAGPSDWWSGASDTTQASEWSFAAVGPTAQEEPTPMMPVESAAPVQPVRDGLLVQYDSYDAGKERWVSWHEVTQDHFGEQVVIRGRTSQISLCANMSPSEVTVFMSAESLIEKRDVLASVYKRLNSEMGQPGQDEQQRGQGVQEQEQEQQQQQQQQREADDEKACTKIVSRLKKSKGTDLAVSNALDAVFETGNVQADAAQPEAEPAGAAEPAAGEEEAFVMLDESEDIAKIFEELSGWTSDRHSLGAHELEMTELPQAEGKLLSAKPLEDAVGRLRLDAIPEEAAAAPPPAAAPESADGDDSLSSGNLPVEGVKGTTAEKPAAAKKGSIDKKPSAKPKPAAAAPSSAAAAEPLGPASEEAEGEADVCIDKDSINDVSEERLVRALSTDTTRRVGAPSRAKLAPLVSNLLAERKRRPFDDLQDCLNRVAKLGPKKQQRLAAAGIFFPTPKEPTKKIAKPKRVNVEWTEEEDAILKDAIARLGEHGRLLTTFLAGLRSHTDGVVCQARAGRRSRSCCRATRTCSARTDTTRRNASSVRGETKKKLGEARKGCEEESQEDGASGRAAAAAAAAVRAQRQPPPQ